MMRGEAISQSVQFDACTGAVSAPVKASIAHLKVNGTANVATLASNNSTTDQTTRIFRSIRSLGQIYGHRCTSVPVRVACPKGLSDAGIWAPVPGAGSRSLIALGPAQHGAPEKLRSFSGFSAFRSHIERLGAAHTLAGTKFFCNFWGLRR